MVKEQTHCMMQKVINIKQAMFCMTRQCWEQGILAQALLETEDYENLSMTAYDIVLRQGEDGRLCNIENTPAVTDSSFCVPAILAAAGMEANEAYKKAAMRNILYLIRKADRSQDGTLYHMRGTREIWADSAAFTPYAMALGGFYGEACDQMRGITAKLYVPEKKLYNHMWDEGKKAFKRPLAWGIGNGWILTGLLRLILCLPEEYAKEKGEMRQLFEELLDSMLSYMTPEGKFHDILDNPDTFLETEVCAMTAYSIFRAINERLIEVSYIDKALLIRNGVLDMTDEEGLVQNCAGSPDFLHPGTSVEGQAHVLMMEKAFSVLTV